MQAALELLLDVEYIISLDFTCDTESLTIGEFASAAGCSWDAFVEDYMTNRGNALASQEDVAHQRRSMINAARKAVDSLERIYSQLVLQIDRNELMLFQIVSVIFSIVI